MKDIDYKSIFSEFDIFDFSILLFFSIAVNSEWAAKSLLWWGATGFFLFSYIWKYKEIKIDLDAYKLWIIGFFFIVVVTIIKAINKYAVINMLKTLIVLFVVIGFLGYICRKRDIWIRLFLSYSGTMT